MNVMRLYVAENIQFFFKTEITFYLFILSTRPSVCAVVSIFALAVILQVYTLHFTLKRDLIFFVDFFFCLLFFRFLKKSCDLNLLFCVYMPTTVVPCGRFIKLICYCFMHLLFLVQITVNTLFHCN